MTICFYGSNSYELRQRLAQTIATYEMKTGSNLGIERIDGAAVTPDDLRRSLSAATFLATSRLVIIENISLNKQLKDKLGDFLLNVPATTVAIFVESQLDLRSSAFKSLKTADKVAKFEPLMGSKLTAWVRSQAARLGASISSELAAELISRVGEDQWRLSNELAKLASLSQEITIDLLDKDVTVSTERSIFDMVEAMCAGKTSRALAMFAELIHQKQSEMYVLSMVQWQLRNLLLVKSAPPTMNPTELTEAASISAYVVSKASVVVARMDWNILRECFADAVTSEYRIKSGIAPAMLEVEQVIWKISERCSVR